MNKDYRFGLCQCIAAFNLKHALVTRKVFLFQALIGQIFSGKLKEKMTLDSSSTGEVTLEQVSDIPGR